MLKIKYFHIYDDSPNSGVTKKILGQTSKLIELGANIELILVGDLLNKYPEYEFIKCIKIKNLYNNTSKGIFFKIKRQYILAKIVKDVVSKLDKGDIIYTRVNFPYCFYIYDLMSFKKKYLTVIEYNSINLYERKLEADLLGYILELVMGSIVLKRSDGLVGVTDEIVEYELNRLGDDPKPHITIGNGIDVHRVKIREPLGIKDNQIEFIFLADIRKWHGINRLLEGLSIYKGKYKVNLNIIGSGNEVENLKKLMDGYKLNNVKFWGFLANKPLDDIFDKCHLAIGSLAIHKKGLTTTSELKLREYAARGIPFIHSALDPDFPAEFLYHLKVSEGDTPINIDELIEYALRINEDPSHPKKMRSYAEKNLDWSIKMSRLKDFFESLYDLSRT
jgi:hypothetical protein